ncbi:hypothetical protein VTO73DRAFT_13145 [Trametes versicolor]
MATKRKLAVISDNMAKLVDSPVTVRPFIPKLVPGLIKIETMIGDPEARSVVNRAIKTLREVGEVPESSDCSDLPPIKMADEKYLAHSDIAIYKKNFDVSEWQTLIPYITFLSTSPDPNTIANDKSALMRAITNGQVEGFSSPGEVRTFYAEHDIDASEAESSVLDFILKDTPHEGGAVHIGANELVVKKQQPGLLPELLSAEAENVGGRGSIVAMLVHLHKIGKLAVHMRDKHVGGSHEKAERPGKIVYSRFRVVKVKRPAACAVISWSERNHIPTTGISFPTLALHTEMAPTNPRRTRPTLAKGKAANSKAAGKKAPKGEPSDEESVGSSGDEDGPGADVDTDKKLVWTTALTWSLITAIEEDKNIKRALYPPPGSNASTAKGGGKAKTEFQAHLATVLFKNHPDYKRAFALTKDEPRQLAAWGRKIKNRIKALETKTRGYLSDMGETGKGIAQEDEIDMSQDNEFTNKWALIKKSFPYLWHMKTLIMQRPNIIRTGIGNGEDDVDPLIILRKDGSSEPPLVDDETLDAASLSDAASDVHAGVDVLVLEGDLEARIGKNSPQPPGKRPRSFLGDKYSSTESEGEAQVKGEQAGGQGRRGGKQKKSPKTEDDASTLPSKKTPARAGASTPSTKSSSKSKKLKYTDQFSEIAAAEETTRQKQLELQLAKTEIEKIKIHAKLNVKRDKDRLKADMMKLRMEQEHELQMMRYKLKWAQGPGRAAGPSMARTLPAMPHSSAPGYSVNLPSDGAGPSTFQEFGPAPSHFDTPNDGPEHSGSFGDLGGVFDTDVLLGGPQPFSTVDEGQNMFSQ